MVCGHKSKYKKVPTEASYIETGSTSIGNEEYQIV